MAIKRNKASLVDKKTETPERNRSLSVQTKLLNSLLQRVLEAPRRRKAYSFLAHQSSGCPQTVRLHDS